MSYLGRAQRHTLPWNSRIRASPSYLQHQGHSLNSDKSRIDRPQATLGIPERCVPLSAEKMKTRELRSLLLLPGTHSQLHAHWAAASPCPDETGRDVVKKPLMVPHSRCLHASEMHKPGPNSVGDKGSPLYSKEGR